MNQKATSEGTAQHRRAAPKTIEYAVLTVSDTRRLENDGSGEAIIECMTASGHQLVARDLVPDQRETITASVGAMRQRQGLDAIILTGGTGIAARDQTPEAIRPLLDAELPGFGELFRMLSFQEIGAAAMLSRACAGRMADKLVFCLPGSTAAVRMACERLIAPEIGHLVHHARQ